jgi:Zn ribbon nucleic-acid-binding protein
MSDLNNINTTDSNEKTERSTEPTPEIKKIHEHKFETTTVEPKCPNQGYTLHKCTICGYEYKDNFIPPQHDFEKTVVEPTCDCDGNIILTCKLCGEERIEVLPSKGHTFGEWIEQKHPTCTTPGSQIRQCSLCGETETREIAPLKHQFTEWRTEGDLKVRDCINCGYTEKMTKEEEEKLNNRKKLLRSIISALYFSFLIGALLAMSGCVTCMITEFRDYVLGLILGIVGLIIAIGGPLVGAKIENMSKDDQTDNKDK